MSAHSDSGSVTASGPLPSASSATRKAKPRSLLQTSVVMEALLVSASVHAVATAILGIPSGASAIPFILFVVSDIVLIALACIPIVGMRRSLLVWHDPLAYLGIIFLPVSYTHLTL